MDKLLKLIDGRKTYIVTGLACVGACLQIFGVAIPDGVWTLLGALGLGAVRDAINKVGK